MFYYVAQATSRKTARCDWLLTWQDYSVMTDGIMPIVNAMWKILKNNFKIILKFFFSLKINKILKWATKNIQTVNFIILKNKKRQRGTLVVLVGILTKLKQMEIPVWKVSSGCIDFRNKKCHIINYLLTESEVFTVKYQTSALMYWTRYRSVDQYRKTSVWYFTVMTSLSSNK